MNKSTGQRTLADCLRSGVYVGKEEETTEPNPKRHRESNWFDAVMMHARCHGQNIFGAVMIRNPVSCMIDHDFLLIYFDSSDGAPFW